MISYVSGEAARGVLLEGGRYYGFCLDSDEKFKLAMSELASFFLHAWDVQEMECYGLEDLKEKIEQFWRRDRTIQLALIAFDPSYSEDLRREAVQCAESLLGEERCLEALLGRLYANTLPLSTRVKDISAFLSDRGASRLEDVFDSVVVRQDAIRKCVKAWEELPDELFESALEREELRARIVQTGAFYKFASSAHGSNDAIFRILADPILASKSAKARIIVSLWASRYKEAPSLNPSYFEFEDDRLHHEREEQSEKSGFETFQRVKKQKIGIKEEFGAGHNDRADALIESLVTDQRKESSPEHLAKSLCDLAMFCRQIGDVDRFFSLSLRATHEAPADAWAYTQLGNASLAKGDFQNAMDAFEKAQIYGEERAALIGRAEALKYLGQKDMALTVLDECVNRFPSDTVASNSRASLLAHFGLLTEALRAYDELAASPFAGAHVYGGRASVLSDLGRFEEALSDQDCAISFAERNDVVPFCAKADILRSCGKFQDALQVLDVPDSNTLTRLQLDTTRARIHRDAGNLADAELILRDLQLIYTSDVGVYIAMGELHRRRGNLSAALDLFLEIEKKFSYSKVSRNSMAATLAALGNYDGAIAYLPTRFAATRGDWVGQHIRAMIEIKRGDYLTAESILIDGLDNCPWPQQKPYFASALAALRIKGGSPSEALVTLKSIGGFVTAETELMVEAVKSHALVAATKERGDHMQGFVQPYLDRATLAPLVENFLFKLKASCMNQDLQDELWESEWSMLLGMAA